MKKNKKRIDRVEDLLIAAHGQRPDLEFPPGWQSGLMQQIAWRAARTRAKGNGFTRAFTGLLFRIAGAGSLAAAAIFVYTYLYGPDLEAQAASLLFDNPSAGSVLERLLLS